jgi:3-hydroxypropanoate dehydrogenase
MTTEAQLFTEAHTAYAFTDRALPPNTAEQIMALAHWAPTAMNSQPMRMVAVDTPEAKARLIPLLAEGNRIKAEQAPLSLILAADLDFHDHLPTVAPHTPNARDNFLDEAKRHAHARNQAWLQAGYVILAIRTLGLAAGPMAGFNKEGVDAEFLADRPWSSFLVVNVGYPSDDAYRPRSPRLEPGVTVIHA